jgi:hypothetical protein
VTFALINTLNGIVSKVRRDNFALVCLGSQAVVKDVHDDVEADLDSMDSSRLRQSTHQNKWEATFLPSSSFHHSLHDLTRFGKQLREAAPRSARDAFVYMYVLTVDTCRA